MNERSVLLLAVVVAVGLVPVSQFGAAGAPASPAVEGNVGQVAYADGAPTRVPNDTTTERTRTRATTERERTDETTARTTDDGGAPSADEIRATAVEASRYVRTYRVASVINQTISTGRITRTVNVTSRGVFDRSARELRVNQTTRSQMRTITSSTYVVDGTLYMRSDVFVRQYSSEWVKTPLSAADERRWELLDTLTRQRAILANASVEYLRTARVNGTRAYVLRADVNETTYLDAAQTRLATADVNITNASFRYWIAADSGRILRSQGTVESRMSLRGQLVNVTQRLSLRFHGYDEPASITLPEGASTAVSLENRTTTEPGTTTEGETSNGETTTEAETTTADGSASRGRPDGRKR